MNIDFKMKPVQEKRKGNNWRIRASIPLEYQHLFKSKHYFHSLGRHPKTENDALALMNNGEAEKFEKKLLSMMNAIDPLIQKADQLLESLYATYNKTNAPNPKDQWYECPFPFSDTQFLKDNQTEEYASVVNRLRMEYLKFEEYGSRSGADVDLDNLYDQIKGELGVDDPNYVTDKDGKLVLTEDGDPIEDTNRSEEEKKLDNIRFLIDQEQEKILEDSVPHYSNWVQAGLINSLVRKGGLIKVPDTNNVWNKQKDEYQVEPNDRKSRDTLFKAYGITDDDLDRYYKVQKAFKDFDDQEHLKSTGRSTLGITFKDAVDGYLKSKPAQTMKLRSLDTWKLAFDDFANLYGWNIDLKKIDKNKAKDFVNYLENEYETPKGKGLANSTIKTKVSAIRSVLVYAEQQTWDFTNTWVNVGVAKRGAKKRTRDRYRPDQLNQLFRMEIPEDLKLLLRILATTGFRLEEASSLEKSDVHYYSNIFVYDLTRANKILKTEQSARMIPVHRDIERYLKPYIDNLKTERLFSNFTADKDGKVSKSASKKLMKYIKQVRYQPDQMLDVHSFRSTFRSKMNNTAGFTDAMIAYVGGWQMQQEGDSYNADEPFEMKRLSDEINKIDVGFIH